MQKVIFIFGPTAVGKSDIAVNLAKKINGEIISADSMQIYRHLDIGTAKITKQEMKGIPHHLIDIKEPYEEYSVSEWCEDAKKCIDKILRNGRVPIIVGGTGLYIKSLIEGYNFSNTKRNDEFRSTLAQLTNEEILRQILQRDNKCGVDVGNRRRLERTLEKLTFGCDAKNQQFNYDYKLFAILDDRENIYHRINNRVDKMSNNGLMDEAKYLLSLGLTNSPAVKAIGYKELFPFIKNETSLNECLDLLKQKSRNYAKRQITFLNQFNNVILVNFCGIEQTANKIIEQMEE